MTNPDDVLVGELEQARAQGDDARVLGLAVAMLAQGGDQRRALAWLDDAAERLIAASRSNDLDAAVSWAQTWAKHARSPRARARAAELQERLAAVQSAEQGLQGALAAGHLPALRAALAALPVDVRRRNTTALAARAEALLADRSAEAAALRRDIAQLIPHQLERALGLAGRLAVIDTSASGERDALARRLVAVDALHRRTEGAFESGTIPELAEAVTALRESIDRRGDSEALLNLAEAELERRRTQLATLRATFAATIDTDIDAAAAALTELAALDPGAPEAERLAEITAARARLEALHATIESGLADPEAPEVRSALLELEQSSLRRPDSAQLITTAHETTEQHRRERERRSRLLTRAGLGTAAVAVLVGGLWWRDRSARAEIGSEDDPHRQLALVREYTGGIRFFAREPMRVLEARLAEDCDRLIFDAARRQPTLPERIAAIEAYLGRPDARRVDDAKAALAVLRMELDDGAFASANRVADPAARFTALADYAQRAHDPSRAERARALAAALRRELDDAAWAAVQATDPDNRAGRAADYLRDTVHVHHREAAEALVAAARSEAERRAADAEDERAWAEAQGSVAGLRAYLARPDGRHRAAAEAAVAAAEAAKVSASEAAAWTAASADGAADERIARLRGYLAGGEERPHAAQAREAIAAIEREQDDAAWAVATAPGTPEEIEERLAAYLAGPTIRAHRAEVEELRQARVRAVDGEAFRAALAPRGQAERILALEAYLTGPTARGYSSAAREEISRSLERLAKSEGDELATVPRAILIRLPTATLARLPAETLAGLPALVQAQVPVRPPWAAESGVDAAGRWAVLPLGTTTVRLRFILPGSVTSPGGTVACAQGFWIAERECSQAQWTAVMAGLFSDGNPSQREAPELPVENLTWRQARDFIAACNDELQRRKLTVRVRVPTVAEWAWLSATASDGAAALDRGSVEPMDAARLGALAWTGRSSGGKPRPCAAGEADAWGLVDLFGNVREWVGKGEERSGAAAGGSWALPDEAATREPLAMGRDARAPDLGLRLAITP